VGGGGSAAGRRRRVRLAEVAPYERFLVIIIIIIIIIILQVYPHLDVWNVVEASEKVTIGNWCNFAHNNCHHRFKVRPFRCLGNDILM